MELQLKIYPIIGFLLILSLHSLGQTKTEILNTHLNNYIDFLAEENIDLTSFQHDLELLFESPVNINVANQNDLLKIPFLNNSEVRRIINYRTYHGQFLTKYELITILHPQKAALISPFICLDCSFSIPFKLKKALKYGRHELQILYHQIIQKQKGIVNKDYIGIPFGSTIRYQYNYLNYMSYAITTNQDIGEPFFNNQKLGFDFISGHLSIKNIGIINNITLGDFRINVGQGLTFWSGFNLGKSTVYSNIKRYGEIIKSHRSTDEINFLRGITSQLQLGIFKVLGFCSSRHKDATLIENNNSFNTFQSSGYHRTASELNSRGTVKETIIGGNVSYSTNYFKIGFTSVYSKFNKTFIGNNRIDNQFNFHGQEQINLGLDYQLQFKGLQLFGETSRSRNGGWATLNGINYDLSSNLYFSLSYRNYQRDFQNLYSNALGERKNNNTEEGIMLSMETRPNNKITIRGFVDFYRIPWLSYNISKPSNYQDYFSQVSINLNKNFEFYFRYRYNKRYQTANINEQLDKIENTDKSQYRLNFKFTFIPNIILKTRIEFINYKISNSIKEHGYLLYQNWEYTFHNIPLKLVLRYGVFDTRSYDSRIYAYENEPPYSFYIPAHYGKGIRTYLLIRFDPTNKISLYVKLGNWFFPFNQTIGSGLNEIQGQHKTDSKVLVKWKF